ncbi:MAG: hypothetical protein FWG87_06585 [Defluviitaleaceae bacterium]|nr:hypothetical protein [Defluviitaleaceae bacterium]
MKKMYRLERLLLALLMVLMVAMLAACGKKDEQPTEAPEVTTETTADPAADPTTDPDQQPTIILENPPSTPFFDILMSDTYHFTCTTDVIDVEVFAKDGMVAVSATQRNGDTSRMIFRDGRNHGISDADRVMMIVQDEAPSFVFSSSQVSYLVSGEAEFNGKILPYDQYIDSTGLITWLFVDVESGELAGLRRFADSGTEDLAFLSLDQNVPDNAFDLPEDYEVINFAELDLDGLDLEGLEFGELELN